MHQPHNRPSASRPTTSRTRALLASVALAVTVPLTSPAFGQQARPAAAPGAAPAARPGAPVVGAAAAPKTGLDALSDEIVMSELASREQDALLNYMFRRNSVTPAQQETIRSLTAIAVLSNTPKERLPERRRQVLVKQSVDGLERALPTLNDPNTLMTWAASLIEKGIEPDVNLLEFWGENPVTQGRVKPAAVVAQKMLEKVAVAAKEAADRLEKQITGPASDKIATEWEKMDALQQTSKYVSNLIAYYVALGIDVSGSNNAAALEERKKVADDAIEYLKQFDVPSEDATSGVQPLVHNRIGKLNFAKADYAAAKKVFAETIAGKVGEAAIKPAPSPAQVYEARYFAALCDVLAKKPDDAQKALDELIAWQSNTANVPAEGQTGVAAAAEMLRFRLLSARADLAKDAAGKAKFEEQAAAVLNKLGEEQPQFKAIITEQLVNRLPENADLTKQSGLVLQALVNKGYGERAKADEKSVDKKVLERAAKAATLMGNPNSKLTGVTPGQVQECALAAPLFYDKLERPFEAAQGYLEYAARYNKTPDDAKTAAQCVDRAFGLAYQLTRGDRAGDPAVKELYGKAIAQLAHPPYSRKEVFYLYADHLRGVEKNIPEALKFYRQVPKGDKMEFNARYWELQLLNAQLQDPKVPADQRARIMADLSKLIENIRAVAASQPQNETTKFRLAYATLLGAELAGQQKQPERALQLLNGFEAATAGAANAEQLINRAEFVRANAFVAAEQPDKATAAVVRLAEKSPDAAKNLASTLLDQLGKDFDRYEAAGDKDGMAKTSANQAKMTNFMVTWTQSSKDEKIQKLVPEYKLYDAKIKLRAGTLATGEEKKKALTDALARAQELQRGSKPESKDPAEAAFATNVAYLVGLAQYDLGDFGAAAGTLGTLIRDGKLGGPLTNEVDKVTGMVEARDNATYWEAMYKWLRSNVERVAADPNNADLQKARVAAQQTLKSMYITFSGKMGGEKWATQFEQLRKDLIPDFDPTKLAPATPATPATQPVAAGTGQ